MTIFNSVYKSFTPVQPRTPWADTIAYYKFEWDADDYSWNWNDLTASGNVSYVTLNWKQVVYFQWANSNSTTRLETSDITLNSSPQTYSIRCRTNSNWSWSPYWWFLIQTFQVSPRIRNWIWNANLSSYVNYRLYKWADNQREQTSVVPDRWDDTFHHIAITISPTECCFYRDWVKEWTFTWLSNSSYTAPIYVWCNDDTNYAFNWYIGETIIESKERTDQEILDYFNQTKADYWIS